MYNVNGITPYNLYYDHRANKILAPISESLRGVRPSFKEIILLKSAIKLERYFHTDGFIVLNLSLFTY